MNLKELQNFIEKNRHDICDHHQKMNQLKDMHRDRVLTQEEAVSMAYAEVSMMRKKLGLELMKKDEVRKVFK